MLAAKVACGASAQRKYSPQRRETTGCNWRGGGAGGATSGDIGGICQRFFSCMNISDEYVALSLEGEGCAIKPGRSLAGPRCVKSSSTQLRNRAVPV